MSKHLGLNPYLPFWETVPDGEPHVFDGRIYIYGSHDKRNGTSFWEDMNFVTEWQKHRKVRLNIRV